MAEQYVKFFRGTFDEYKSLNHKEEDTLYFLYNEEDITCALYLGTRLIAGSGEIIGASNIDELNDVLISAVGNKDILQYDNKLKQWINITFDNLLKQIQEKLSISTGASVYVVQLQDGETHEEALRRRVGSSELIQGDIGIVKELINNNNYQHTAYVYDNDVWVAMDGNYNAENVYFKTDLLTTTPIGHIKLVDGKATIPTAGKNLKEIFDTIFLEKRSPEVKQPNINFIFHNEGTYEVGTVVTPSWEIIFDEGNYEFGPTPTGVQVNSINITSSDGDISQTAFGRFEDLLIKDDTYYTITAEISYSDGDIPVTNLGEPSPADKIVGTTISIESNPIIGYRPFFYGLSNISVKDGANLTSDFIRSLTDGGKYKPTVLNLSSYEGAKSLVVAVHEDEVGVVEAIMPSTLNFPLPWTNNSPLTVSVQGVDGYSASNYKVWVYEPALIDKLETYKITLG